MKTTVQRFGRGLGIRIPNAIAERLGLRAGTTVDLEVSRGALRVVRRPPKGKFQLSELLAQMKPGKRHREFDRGAPVGKEMI